jgi:hypothetical protein
MVKQLYDKNTKFSNGNVLNHENKSKSKLDNSIIKIPDSLLSQNLHFIPKNSNFSGKTFSKKDNYKKEEQNTLRKKSYNSEDSTSTEEINDLKNKKKISQNNNKNKNKVPFKGEAKDFKIKYKTELCKYYEIDGHCKYGDKCAYAHGKENLRSKVTNTTAYRTKKCTQFFEQGYCPYGSRCQFAHQLKSNIINNPYDRGMTYGKILETISKLENVENIKKLIEKPRLPVFLEFSEEKIESRLLEDIKSLTYNDLFQRIDN